MTTTPPETEAGLVAEAPPEEETESFGTWLRRQRELREITLREIADTSKISIRYLQALEEERFDMLPAEVFAKGFLRQYARYVGLDPEETVNFFLAANGQEKEEEVDPVPRRPKSVATWSYALVALVAAILLMAVVWGLLRLNRDATNNAGDGGGGASISHPGTTGPPPAGEDGAAPSSAGAPAAPGTVGSAPGQEAVPAESRAQIYLTLDFRGDCWIRATVDGDTRADRVYTQGESLQLEGAEAVELELGNVFKVDIEVNGIPMELDEESDNPIRRLRIDLETVAALRQGGLR